MYGIFTYIYHKNQPNVGNIPYMDPMSYTMLYNLYSDYPSFPASRLFPRKKSEPKGNPRTPLSTPWFLTGLRWDVEMKWFEKRLESPLNQKIWTLLTLWKFDESEMRVFQIL